MSLHSRLASPSRDLAYIIRREAVAVKRFALTPAELRKAMHDRRIKVLATVIATGDHAASDYASAALWHGTVHNACVKQARLLFAARLSQMVRDYAFARTMLTRAAIHHMTKTGRVLCERSLRLPVNVKAA